MVGFTRNETAVLLFLVVSFIVGVGVWAYRNRWSPLPEISEEESEQRTGNGASFGNREGINIENAISVPVVSLNDADCKDFELLPGIGPVMAARIIEYRKLHGRFHSLEELMEVKGIGHKTLEKLKPYLKLQ